MINRTKMAGKKALNLSLRLPIQYTGYLEETSYD